MHIFSSPQDGTPRKSQRMRCPMTTEFKLDSIDFSKWDNYFFANCWVNDTPQEVSILSRYTFHAADFHFTGIFYLRENFIDSYTEGYYLPDVSGRFLLNKNNSMLVIEQGLIKLILSVNYDNKVLQWQKYERAKDQQWQANGWNTIVAFQ